jgi:hypothetical protein
MPVKRVRSGELPGALRNCRAAIITREAARLFTVECVNVLHGNWPYRREKMSAAKRSAPREAMLEAKAMPT